MAKPENKIKVVIHIEGGMVQNVYAPKESPLDITVVDVDARGEGGEAEDEDYDGDADVEKETKGLVPFPY